MATGTEPHWPREIELKLALAPGDQDAVLDHPLVRRRLAAAPRQERLHSRYFDTPDRALRARDATLRIRRTRRGFVQTLKLADEPRGALADRIEWSCPVEDFAPRPERLPPELASRAGLNPGIPLEPVFETRILRRTARLRWRESPGGRVELELALDRGRILAGARREPVSELELELRHGPAAAAFAFAERLGEALPLRPSSADKAARGHLLDGAPPPSYRAVRPPLEPSMSSAAAFRRLLRAILVHWLASDTAVRYGRETEAVHQLRVALRRGLVLFGLFRTVLPVADRERLRRRTKTILAGLAEMRELDVVRAEFLETVPAAGEDAAALIAPLELRRAKVRNAVLALLESPAYAAFLLELAAWLEREGWREHADAALLLRQELPVAEHASRVLGRCGRRLARACRHLDRLDVEGRHELRLAAKRLRYAIDFFAPLYPAGRTAAWLRRLRRLQDLLGEDSDFASLRPVLDRLLAEAPRRDRERLASAAGFVLGWHRHRLAILPRRLEKEVAKLRALRPPW